MSEQAEQTDHWQSTWADGPHEERGWFQSEPEPSFELVRGHTPDGGAVVDVGGGASLLVDRLLDAGFEATVVDLAPAALDVARERLGSRAEQVTFVRADVTDLDLGRAVDTWHDRAVLHFLLADDDREAYVASLRRHLRVGGNAVIATFAPDGPERCSGLPVRRHGPADLVALMGDGFDLVEDRHVVHRTPSGADQAFVFTVFRRRV